MNKYHIEKEKINSQFQKEGTNSVVELEPKVHNKLATKKLVTTRDKTER